MKKVDIQKKDIIAKRGKKFSKKLPKLETMFEDEGDPLEDVEYDPADLEASADREMTEIVRLIKEKKKALQDKFRIANDPDYWFALCFQSHEQRDEFLQKAGWIDLGVKYLNGLEVARRMGVDVKVYDVEPKPLRGKPKKYQRKEVI